LLDELATRGLKLAICTNKPAGITEDVLVKLGLRGAFSAVVAGTDALPKKPNPAMLLAALSALGVYPDEAVMIGDSGADVGAAEAAGIPVIAVTYGYTRTPPAELGANLLIDRLEEVVAAFEKLRPV
jgi:phosphoglycolate phosphatase